MMRTLLTLLPALFLGMSGLAVAAAKPQPGNAQANTAPADTPPGGGVAQGNAQYRLASGDVIRINVFGEKDLSFEEIILSDAGTFSYPFIGEVQARGKTAADIEAILIRKLQGDFLVDPRVSVRVLKYRQFYISGEVKTPGGYPYQPGLTLRSAAALAGGLTERASTGRITIIREGDPQRTPQKATLDTPINPGDTITIDMGFF